MTHTNSGEGLLFFGNTTIPFVDRFPQNTELYAIMTTRPEDKKQETRYPRPHTAGIGTVRGKVLPVQPVRGDCSRYPPLAPAFENSVSDFLVLLSQAQGDRQILAKQLGISPHQLSYVTHTNSGEGLLFFGNTCRSPCACESSTRKSEFSKMFSISGLARKSFTFCLVCLDLKKLGAGLRTIAMLIMQDLVNSQVSMNFLRGIATWC